MNSPTHLYTMGIGRQITTANSPQSNGVAERMNRTLMDAARSMLHAAGLPINNMYWRYALYTAVYLRNRSPTNALESVTPYHAWRGDKPDLSHLKTFGCRAYMHLDKHKRNKLQSRSIPVIFVGYTNEAKAWRVYDPGSKKEHTSRDVTVHESVAGSTLLTSPPTAVRAAEPAGGASPSSVVSAAEPADGVNVSSGTDRAAEPTDTHRSILDFTLGPDSESDQDNDDEEAEAIQPVHASNAAAAPSSSQAVSDITDSVHRQQIASESPAVDNVSPSIQQSNSVSSSLSNSPSTSQSNSVISGAVSSAAAVPVVSRSVISAERSMPSRSQRKKLSAVEKAARQLASHNALGNTERADQLHVSSYLILATHVSESISEPSTYREAARSPHRVQWEQAMKEELDSIKANNTYMLVPLPVGRQAIGSKWVYKVKRHADGSVDRFKARLVAKGYSQVHGIDFTETFAPVVRFSSLRAILAITAAADYEIHQMDVKTAFLNGDLTEEHLHAAARWLQSHRSTSRPRVETQQESVRAEASRSCME